MENLFKGVYKEEGGSVLKIYFILPSTGSIRSSPRQRWWLELKKVSSMESQEDLSRKIAELLRKVRLGEMPVSEARSKVETMVKESDAEEEKTFLQGLLNSMNDKQQASIFYRAISSEEELLKEYADRISSWFEDIGSPTPEEKLFVEVWGKILRHLSGGG